MRTIDNIIIHCSATKAGMDVGVYEIDRWHRTRGWLSCGYHYVIKRNGTVEKGRPEEETGAHCAGQNQTSIGVCLVGGLADDGKTPVENYTEEQWLSLTNLAFQLTERYPNAALRGHKDFTNKKTCPNFNVKEWWDATVMEKAQNNNEKFYSMLDSESKFYPKRWQ